MATEHTPVLVVGGSLTGLSSAVFLAWHGVPCVVVERHPDLLMHPRLRGIGPRTIEAFRQVGLESAIQAASYGGTDFRWEPIRAETLADAEYAGLPEEGDGEDLTAASPCGFGPIDQDRLEVVLRARATELGADLRFATELTAFEQGADGVTARLRDGRTGQAYDVRADYLIAADGWTSPLRQQLGIEVDGPGALFHTITAIVEADLSPATRGRRVSLAYLQQPQPFTIVMAHDEIGHRWVFGTGYSPEHESLNDYTDERVADLVRSAAGLPDVKVTLHAQIPGTDKKVLGFSIGAQVARNYRAGRAFLVGDAAHLVPPTGGLGGNAGIQDAHNLAWKLAAVVRGEAGPGLLDTYHDERQPIGQLTMAQAFARFGSRMGPGAEVPLIDYASVAMGYQYRSAAITGAAEDTAPLRPQDLAGQPGTRAPHLTITKQGREISTIDLYGRTFVLLAGADAGPWVEAARGVAMKLDLPVEAYRFGVELTSADGPARHGIGTDGALLVRPDGVVAWRSQHGTSDATAELTEVVRAVLHRA
ncbi:FAD-dependent monooxygenase [Actinopolymorpha alba]|uniref:FAD-dependent monooxygenase n=1 Tax=Actinopolymorpha alba TaxID=533267 RepID=UPI0003768277|nr:FAD-dependent monooxygenase [Actinopolymorpha alba]